VEARQHNAVKRVLARWLRYDVIVLDEVGYVPLADIGAEFLFQVIAERAERATLIVTTNLPFSEWTQVFPNPRLCKALLIESRTGRTSSRLAPSPTAFAEPWRCARKRKHRRHRRSGFYIAGAKEGAQTPPLPLHSIPAGEAGTCRTRQASLLLQVGPNVNIKAGPNQNSEITQPDDLPLHRTLIPILLFSGCR
jgi:hypothetical protein